MVKMEIKSIRLDMKLVFEFTENVPSEEINSSTDGNRKHKHGKVLNVYLCEMRLIYFSVVKMHSYVCSVTSFGNTFLVKNKLYVCRRAVKKTFTTNKI